MATLVHRESTGEKEFSVPFSGPIPGAPFESGGELLLSLFGDHPVRYGFRFRPSNFEFLAKLPRLVAGTPFEASIMAIGTSARGAQPVLEWEADDATVAKLPAGVGDLERLEAYLTLSPPSFDAAHFNLVSISFEEGGPAA